ncbi:MAG: hypothetical protein NTX79_06630 [Candidatus Micrarchaeota archaeon]|nr:hypothetical protein [Candidatus Micrarchaeota archaeon]
MAKNMLRHFRFETEDERIAQQQQKDSRSAQWIINFAGRLMKDNAGVVLASPYVPRKPYAIKALKEYSENITALHHELAGVDNLFFIAPFERGSTSAMFHGMPRICVFILGNKIDVAELLPRAGNPRMGGVYPPQVIEAMRLFADKSSSFLITGTHPAVEMVQSALFEYLANRGMHAAKQIKTDARFICPISKQ